MRILFLVVLFLTASVSAEPAASSPEETAEFAAEYGLTGRLIFTAEGGGSRDIYLLNLADGRTHRLTDSPGRDEHPAVSPDGRRLAWVSERDGRPDIYLMELGPDGAPGPHRRLTDTPAREADLSWSSDGKRLYFAAEEPWERDAWSDHVGDEAANRWPERETFWAVYYLVVETGEVEPQSIEPGDHRCPVHFAGYGTVCFRTTWEEGAPRELVLVHHALLEEVITIPGDPEELYGPITRRPPEPSVTVQFPFLQEGMYAVKSFSLDRLDTSANKVLPTRLEALTYAREPGGLLGGARIVEDDAGDREIWLNLTLPATGGVVDRRLTDNELFELELLWAPTPAE